MHMRYIFSLFLLILAHSANAQLLSAADPSPDTLRGIALVLAPGGTMTLDTLTNQLKMVSDPEGIVIPVKCICVRIPIDLVPADMRGQNVGYVTRFFRIDTGAEISGNDVLIFKIRE